MTYFLSLKASFVCFGMQVVNKHRSSELIELCQVVTLPSSCVGQQGTGRTLTVGRACLKAESKLRGRNGVERAIGAIPLTYLFIQGNYASNYSFER